MQWTDERPVYRAYFWSQAGAPPEVDPDKAGWQSEEFEIRDAEDIHQVIAWARRQDHRERTYTLYVVVECDGQPGLVHLAGVDPTNLSPMEP
jgi:hypothetical protein